MELLVFRHGAAEDQAADGSDASRALTPAGIKRTEAAARGLARIASPPAVILTSPKLRALQTAEAAGRAFGTGIETLEALAEGTVADVISALAMRPERSIMIVGHEPTLSELVETLCAERPRGSIELKKAGCACLEVEQGETTSTGSLRWLATPKMLVALAGGGR